MRQRFVELAAALVIAGALIAWQEIPPADDSYHPGQPEWCQNFRTKLFGANCACKRECKDGAAEDLKCKVYCRKHACRCDHKCES